MTFLEWLGDRLVLGLARMEFRVIGRWFRSRGLGDLRRVNGGSRRMYVLLRLERVEIGVNNGFFFLCVKNKRRGHDLLKAWFVALKPPISTVSLIKVPEMAPEPY